MFFHQIHCGAARRPGAYNPGTNAECRAASHLEQGLAARLLLLSVDLRIRRVVRGTARRGITNMIRSSPSSMPPSSARRSSAACPDVAGCGATFFARSSFSPSAASSSSRHAARTAARRRSCSNAMCRGRVGRTASAPHGIGLPGLAVLQLLQQLLAGCSCSTGLCRQASSPSSERTAYGGPEVLLFYRLMLGLRRSPGW